MNEKLVLGIIDAIKNSPGAMSAISAIIKPVVVEVLIETGAFEVTNEPAESIAGNGIAD